MHPPQDDNPHEPTWQEENDFDKWKEDGMPELPFGLTKEILRGIANEAFADQEAMIKRNEKPFPPDGKNGCE